ncbi:MAG: homoserine dehydrogenase [Alphaproteobacteria bacterium]|nr:homoserine dehydrogenase [Alphaproteobacteria bacterium]
MKPLRVGLAGLGTVGAAVAKIVAEQGTALASRCGRPLELTAVSARDKARDRGVSLTKAEWFSDPLKLATSAQIDVFIELMGGEGDPAKASVEAALARGVPVVTGNKALLAHHGVALAKAAEAKGVALNYEAAVAGGIPIVKALREGLGANRVERVYGILNGTCNYILTTMEASGRAFADVLGEAQRLGYAEADPTFDIGGMDTAHKLCLLAAVAFGNAPALDGIHVEGIERISPMDIMFAREFGFRIKLLGVASRADSGIEQRVHPAMVPLGTPLADVDGVFNAVVADGDLVGKSVYEGRGAGAGPTASAVMSDLLDIARGVRLPTFGAPAATIARPKLAAMGDHQGACYLRFTVIDRPGVIAVLSRCLADQAVSIESMLQRSRAPGEPVPVVMITHEAREAAMTKALAAIVAAGVVTEQPVMIRMERF